MPGAMKRKAPINLNASPARVAAALAQHSGIPMSVVTVSMKGLQAATNATELEDDEPDDDPRSSEHSAYDKPLTSGTGSEYASPHNPASHSQRRGKMAATGTHLSPIPENPSSPPTQEQSSRNASMDQSLQAVLTGSDGVFSPRNHAQELRSHPIIAYYRPPRTPNRPELYQARTSEQGSSESPYTDRRSNQGSPVSASSHPSQDLQLSRSNSTSPARGLLRTPIPPRHENIMNQMLAAIMPVLQHQNQLTFQRIGAMEDVIKSLAEQVVETSNEVKKLKAEEKSHNGKLLDLLRNSFKAQSGDNAQIKNQLDGVTNLVKENHSEDPHTLIDKLDTISSALESVSECVNALKPAVTADTPPDAGPTTQVIAREFAEAGTSYDLLEDENMRSASQELVTRVEAATSPVIFHQYLDAAVEILPLGMDTEEIGISTEELVHYTDMGTARTPEPEPMEVVEQPIQRLDAATSPLRDWYVDSGTMARTPEPSPSRRVAGVMTSPSPSPPRRQYVDSGTHPRSPEPLVSRLSLGLMTSPSPQRFAAGSLGGRASRRSSAGVTTLAASPIDDIPMAPRELTNSPQMSMSAGPAFSPSSASTRHGTPEGANIPTQRTDSMPGMVTPPVSSPIIDLKAYMKSSRTAGLKPNRLSYSVSQVVSPVSSVFDTGPALSEQVDWNRSFQDDNSIASPTTPSSELPPIATLQDDPSSVDPYSREVSFKSQPTSPARSMSPCQYRSSSLDDEVESSVKGEQTYEPIEAEQTFNPPQSSIEDFSQHSEQMNIDFGHSSIGTFGESADVGIKTNHSSIATFEEEESIDGPQESTRALSIESSRPPTPVIEEDRRKPEDGSVVDPDAISQVARRTPEPQKASTSEELDASPVSEEEQPTTTADSLFGDDEVEEPVEQPAEKTANQRQEVLVSGPCSPYFPTSDLRSSPIRSQPVVQDAPAERPTTPVTGLFDNAHPYSPTGSVSSEQDGSELSVARLIMASASQSPEKLPPIPESAPYEPSPPPMAVEEPTVSRQVIDLSTPSLPNTPARPVHKDREEEAPLFKVTVPQLLVSPTTSTPLLSAPVASASCPPASASTSANTSAGPQSVVAPICISSSRESSPLSEPPTSDDDKGPAMIESDSDIEFIPVKKRKADQTEPSVKSEAPNSKKKKILNIKAVTLGLQSVATTRVKKRKVMPVDPTAEPPLKRARERSVMSSVSDDVRIKAESVAITVKRTPISKGKGKEKESISSSQKTRSTPRSTPQSKKSGANAKGAKWPPFPKGGNEGFFKGWIECTPCENWYHYGCVGIRPGDSIIDSSKRYICPPCKAKNGTGPRAKSNLPILQKGQRFCARPDCGNPSEEVENQFFVDCIVGRATKVEGGRRRRFIWLLRWDGYSILESTWEEEDSMDDSASLIADFYRKATDEGYFPDNDPHSTIMLKEAVDAGCIDPAAI